jgi:hypothetical protein
MHISVRERALQYDRRGMVVEYSTLIGRLRESTSPTSRVVQDYSLSDQKQAVNMSKAATEHTAYAVCQIQSHITKKAKKSISRGVVSNMIVNMLLCHFVLIISIVLAFPSSSSGVVVKTTPTFFGDELFWLELQENWNLHWLNI